MNTQFFIRFFFRTNWLTAFVKIRSIGYDLKYSVFFRNKELTSQIEGGEFVFTLVKGIEKPVTYSPEAEELMLATTQAITEYVERDAA